MAWYFLTETSHVELLNITDPACPTRGGGGDLHRCLVTVEGAKIQKNNLRDIPLEKKRTEVRGRPAPACEPQCFRRSLFFD